MGVRVWDLDLWCRVYDLGLRGLGFGFRVWGLGLWFTVLGLRFSL